MVRSLARAEIPVILLDENALSPATHSVYVQKVAISRLSGAPMVKELLALAASIAGPAVLFLNSDDAVLTVSEYRTDLENDYRFRLPSHACLTSLINKTSFQQLAEEHGFPVPRSITIGHIEDLSRLAELRFPCIVKPIRGPRITPERDSRGATKSLRPSRPRASAVASSPSCRVSSFKNGSRVRTAIYFFVCSTARPTAPQCVPLPAANSASGHRMSASQRAAPPPLRSARSFNL